MFHYRCLIMNIHIWESMCTALISQQQRVTLAVITSVIRFLRYTDQSAIRILAVTGRNTFADNCTTGILTEMNHLRTCIRLLVVISHSHRIKFCCRIITCQDTGRIFPGNRRTGFHLCPGKFAIHSFAVTSLRHKIVYTAFTFGISRIPILNRTVFHFCTVMHDNLYNSSVQLILIPHRSRTSFQIRYIRIIIRHNQRTFKLSRVTGIDTEISRKLHRTTHPLRNIHKRTVGEYS